MGQIKDLQKQIHAIAREKGWWDLKRNPGELIVLMHCELSEAVEALRTQNPEDNNVGEELADCVIRIMDACEGAFNVDLEHEIIKKIEKNKIRPYKHGKKF